MIKYLSSAIVLLIVLPVFCLAQADSSKSASALAKSNEEVYRKAAGWSAGLNGRNWRQLYKAYVDKVKAEKEAAKN